MGLSKLVALVTREIEAHMIRADLRRGDTHPDGTQLATASADGTARLWDPRSGMALVFALEGHTKARSLAPTTAPMALAVLTVSLDETARVWDVATGQLLERSSPATAAESPTARFSSDGARVVTVSRDGTGMVWDAASERPRDRAPGRPHGVRQPRRVHRRRHAEIVTVSQDGTARIWSARHGILAGNPGRAHRLSYSSKR